MPTPFLFLSALNERDDKIRAHARGCDAYLANIQMTLNAPLSAMMRHRLAVLTYAAQLKKDA